MVTGNLHVEGEVINDSRNLSLIKITQQSVTPNTSLMVYIL